MRVKRRGLIRTVLSEVTSPAAATAASKILRSKRASKAAKSAAGSALTQVPRGGYRAKKK